MTLADLPVKLSMGITIDPETECWVWTGGISSNGYGNIWHDGRQWLPHRLSYSLLVGPLESGLSIDHLCRNRPCCNPSHLEQVTQGENVRRTAVLQTHCRNGHRRVGIGRCLTCHATQERSYWTARQEAA